MTPTDNLLLRRLARVKPIYGFIVALALLLGGLFLPGIVGGALLFVLGLAVAALTFTTWPVQPPRIRIIRAALLVLLFAVAVAKIV